MFTQLISFSGMPEKYNRINNVLSRSAQPKQDDFLWLKEQGVTDIIDLKTGFEKSFIKFNEKETVEKLGLRYHNIATIAHHPNEEKIKKFLDIIEQAGRNNGKVHVHCLQGADRTGMYTFIYKSLNFIDSIQNNLQEWLDMGHNRILFPNLINWAKDYINKNLKN